MRFTPTAAVASLALAATFVTSPVHAAPILGTAGAGLQNASAPQENSGRFWDGNSWDSNSLLDGAGASNPCNIGSLAGGTGCGLNPAAVGAATQSGQVIAGNFTLGESGTGFQAWGNGDGTADLSYGFDSTGGGLYDFRMLGEFTDDWNINEIGWYDLGNPQDRHTIFSASAAVGATTQVFIPSNFGFYYLNTSGNGEMFFTQSRFNVEPNQDATHKQQFASFQLGEFTIMGVEDIFSNTLTPTWQAGAADYDYNDVMFGFRAASSVPEPTTLLLLGMGLAGIAVKSRRKLAAA